MSKNLDEEELPEYLVWHQKQFVEILQRGEVVAVVPVQCFPVLPCTVDTDDAAVAAAVAVVVVVVVHLVDQLAGHPEAAGTSQTGCCSVAIPQNC